MQQAQVNLTKEQPRSNHLPHQHSQQSTTPVAQALAEYQSNHTHNPFEARIKALIQSKAQIKDDTEWSQAQSTQTGRNPNHTTEVSSNVNKEENNMEDTSLKKLTTEQQATLLAKEVAQ